MPRLTVSNNFSNIPKAPDFQRFVSAWANQISDFFNGNIDHENLKNGSVTPSKLSPSNVVLSDSSGAFSSSSGSETDITNFSVEITSNGRPIIVTVVGDGSNLTSSLRVLGSTGVPLGVFFLYRGSTRINRFNLGGDTATGIEIPPSAISVIETLSAGTYTYTLKAVSGGGGTHSVEVNHCKLLAYEL